MAFHNNNKSNVVYFALENGDYNMWYESICKNMPEQKSTISIEISVFGEMPIKKTVHRFQNILYRVGLRLFFKLHFICIPII